MSILVFDDAKLAAAAAATLIASQLLEAPRSVLGLEYAPALLPVMDSLSAMEENGLLDMSRCRIFQLTELVKQEGKDSLYSVLQQCCYTPLHIKPEQIVAPEEQPVHWANSFRTFDAALLEAGGLDMALVSIKPDGTLLFNGPGEELAPGTHVELCSERKTITAGLPQLLQAKKIVVLLCGNDMAQAAFNCLKGPLSCLFPAGFLQLHGAVSFLLDREAAALLG